MKTRAFIRNMILVITILSPLLLWSGKVQAQDLNEHQNILPTDELIYIRQMLLTPVVFESLQMQLYSQERSQNSVQQLSEGLLSGTNISQIIQTGNYNQATSAQYGTGNFSLIVQSGHYNDAELMLYGNNNLGILEQYGNHNTAEKTITGDMIEFKLTQIGTDLNLSIQGDLPSGTRITQRGAGLNLQIK